MALDTLVTSDLDLMNARPLDVHRWSEYPEVNDFVNEIYSTLKSIKGHQNTGKKLVKVLLLDLYVAWSGDPSMKIMFSRDNNAYKAKSRYSELHIGKTIIGIVDTLVTEGIIHEQKGFNDRITGIGFKSRLWASEGLHASNSTRVPFYLTTDKLNKRSFFENTQAVLNNLQNSLVSESSK